MITKALILLIIISSNCFGTPIEKKLESIKDVETYNKILNIESENKNGFSPPELPDRLCKIGQNIAVLIKDTGSGVYVYNLYIINKIDNTWYLMKHSRYSTANPLKSPDIVRMEHNVITILSKDGKVLDTFDVTQ